MQLPATEKKSHAPHIDAHTANGPNNESMKQSLAAAFDPIVRTCAPLVAWYTASRL
jgi:hypothetical protein